MQREGPLKRDIYNNNDKIIKFDNEDSKRIFDFLNDNKRRTYKQTELSEILSISKPKVSRLLGKLVGKEKPYGKSKYMVVKKNKEYTVVVLNEDEKYDEERIKREYVYRDRLNSKKIWIKEYAEKVNDYVVIYEINSRMSYIVLEALDFLYKEYIHAIVKDKNKLYIILKSTSDDKKLARINQEICLLYGCKTK